jgi:hypothetical protein
MVLAAFGGERYGSETGASRAKYVSTSDSGIASRP